MPASFFSMLSPIAAPVAATSPQTFRGLKKLLLELVSGPQYLEYLYADPPSIKFTMSRIEDARVNSESTSDAMFLLQTDINALLIAEQTEELQKTLILRNTAMVKAELDFIRQSQVLAALQKNREAEMAEAKRYENICNLIVPTLGRFKDLLLQSTTLGAADTQISVKKLFERLDDFIAKSEPVSATHVVIALAALITLHAIPGLYSDICDRFQRFYSGFNSLREPYVDEPTLLVLLSPTVFVGAILEALPRSEGSPGFIAEIQRIRLPYHDEKIFSESSCVLSNWFASLLSVANVYGRKFVLAPPTKAILATVAKGSPRRSGLNLREATPAVILALTEKHAKDVLGSCVCPVHGPEIGRHPLWLCNTFLNRLDELPPAGKNADFMALVVKHKPVIDANRLKYAASPRDAPK